MSIQNLTSYPWSRTRRSQDRRVLLSHFVRLFQSKQQYNYIAIVLLTNALALWITSDIIWVGLRKEKWNEALTWSDFLKFFQRVKFSLFCISSGPESFEGLIHWFVKDFQHCGDVSYEPVSPIMVLESGKLKCWRDTTTRASITYSSSSSPP